MYKVLIWGCGTAYNAHLLHLRRMEETGEARIVGVYSRDLHFGRTLDGFPILSKNEIPFVEHDYLLVMATKGQEEILKEYLALGGRRDKFLPCRVLDLPDLSFSRYIRIKEARFSILSETCYAGILYNTLCMEVLSPFKNLWVARKDYFRILADLPHYMSLSPVLWKPSDYAARPYDQPGYPILRLDGDILLNCNHYSDPDDAISKWNERRRKINYQNILATFFAEDRGAEEEFYQLPVLGRRLCFTPYPSDLPDSAYVPEEGGEYSFTGQHRTGKPYNTLIDIYSLFFGPVKYRRFE